MEKIGAEQETVKKKTKNKLYMGGRIPNYFRHC